MTPSTCLMTQWRTSPPSNRLHSLIRYMLAVKKCPTSSSKLEVGDLYLLLGFRYSKLLPLCQGKLKVSLIKGVKYFLENIHPIHLHLVRRLENRGRVKIKLVMRKGAFI